MSFHPIFTKQAPDWGACMFAGGVTEYDRDTRGTKRAQLPTISLLRGLAGVPTGGTDFEHIDLALRKFDGSDHMDVRSKIAWSDAMTMLKAGQGFSAIVDYGVVVHLGYNGNQSAGFRGLHQWGCYDWHPENGGEVLKYDPLLDARRPEIPQDPSWIPEAVFRQAAGAYIGAGYLQAGFTRDTEVSYHATFPAGEAFFAYNVSIVNGYRTINPLDPRKRYRFRNGSGASCGPPVYCRWPGQPTGRSLDLITAGFLKGKYVPRKYAKVVP